MDLYYVIVADILIPLCNCHEKQIWKETQLSIRGASMETPRNILKAMYTLWSHIGSVESDLWRWVLGICMCAHMYYTPEYVLAL
jgi:hypothetical protein